jgi:hypothetical protein
MTLSGPFSQDTTVQDTFFNFEGTNNNFIGIPSANPTGALNSSSYASIIGVAFEFSLLGVSFSAYPRQFQFFALSSIQTNEYINFMIYSGSTYGLQNTFVPNFISNIYTRYEICFQYTVSSVTYGFCKPLTTFPYTAQVVDFNIVCTSTGQAGFTAQLSFTPHQAMAALGTNLLNLNFQIVAGYTASFDKGLSSGLTSGSLSQRTDFQQPTTKL